MDPISAHIKHYVPRLSISESADGHPSSGKVIGLAGRFTLSTEFDPPRDIKIFDPQESSATTIILSDYRRSYVPQFREADDSIFRARAVIPHADRTFTVVALGGVISEWSCQKLEQKGHLLYSLQLPGTLMNKARVSQVAFLADRVFVTTVEESSIKLYLYRQGKLTDITPKICFDQIESQGSCLLLKEGDREVGDFTFCDEP